MTPEQERRVWQSAVAEFRQSANTWKRAWVSLLIAFVVSNGTWAYAWWVYQ